MSASFTQPISAKERLRTFVKKSGILDTLRDTFIYTLYCRVVLKQSTTSFEYLCKFYRQQVREFQIPTEVWFDVGANVGDKSSVFSTFAQRVIALEPDPANVLSLKRRFRFKKKVTIIETAVGASSGKATMTVGWGAYSTLAPKQRELNEKNTIPGEIHSVEVGVISLDELIGQFGVPGYIKVDVEGYEETVLMGLTQKIPFISFEANLPSFEAETVRCIEHLARISPEAKFNYVATEPPESFTSQAWLSPADMSAVVKSGTYHYMEIFARS